MSYARMTTVALLVSELSVHDEGQISKQVRSLFKENYPVGIANLPRGPLTYTVHETI